MGVYLRMEWWYFVLTWSKTLPRNIEFGCTPEFGTPAVPSLCPFLVLASYPYFLVICLCSKTLIHGCQYLAPVTPQPRKGRRAGRREAIISLWQYDCSAHAGWGTTLCHSSLVTDNPCFPARDLPRQCGRPMIGGSKSDGGVATELVVWKREAIARWCSKCNVRSAEH